VRPRGFGITYDAQDSDGSRVAIKEYFPQDLVARQSDGSVVPYEQYLQAFYKFWTISVKKPERWPHSTTPTSCTF
jgi:hypothetical protein